MKKTSGRRVSERGLATAPEMTEAETKQRGWRVVKSYAFEINRCISFVHYMIKKGMIVAKSHNGRIYVKKERD